MSDDPVARAKAILSRPRPYAGRVGFEDALGRDRALAALVPELITEVECLRRNVRYLDLVITEEVAHLTEDECAEIDELRKEFG